MGLSRTEALRASIDGFMHRVRKMIFALGEVADRPSDRLRMDAILAARRVSLFIQRLNELL
jgi:hypothetical protein